MFLIVRWSRWFRSCVILWFLLQMCKCALEPTFKRCCSLGSNWASEGLKCNNFPAPVTGIQPEQQSVCLTAVEICCLRKHREKQCEIGKEDARSDSSCQTASITGGEYRKDCCEACKLGLMSGSMGMECVFESFEFEPPWDKAYHACCLETQPSTSLPTTTSASATAGNPENKTTVIPTPALDSLCELLPGELCAHICVPVPGSFRCECREGFTLMADGKSCQHDDLPDRCKINNPCAHKCLDTGIAIECSCHPGYKLASDERNCNDVNECALGIYSCDSEDQACRNEPGSYLCINPDGSVAKPLPRETDRELENDFGAGKCPLGYKFSMQSQVCDDIDECALNVANCGTSSACQNTIGSYICVRTPVESCPPGYRFDHIQQICSDIDECSEGLDDCQGDKYLCFNTEGNYTCQPQHDSKCPAGYKYSKDAASCEDVNECEEGTHVCNLEACINEPGGYRCGPTSSDASQCQAGFKLDHSTNTCVDVDECVENVDPPCDSNQDCINSHGSFQCVCKTGFQFDSLLHACVDVNECQVNKHDCLPSQRCDNTIGSFHCIRYTSCGTGYTLNAQTGLCEDDDECSLGTDNCRNLGPTWQCRNTLGSFRCERKRCDGKKVLLNNGECKLLECPTGYEASQQGQCIDINECEHNNPCRRNQRCVNTGGSYRCINYLNCGGGFELNESGNQCIDIDECAKSTHDCGHGQQCINRVGGYVCQCPGGHIINEKKECIDVDECTRYAGQVCATNSKCVNTVGSYRCACSDGFRQDPKGGNGCVDIDECAESPGLCEQNCINIWGSYRCSCNPGFALKHDNRSCLDIDECEQFKDHNLCVGICVNQPGSYSCQCPEGYRIGTDGRTCQDIDECLGGNNCHNPNEVCLNTRGGHRCNSITCPPNFIKDPEHKNRCKRASLFCREGDTECLHLPSSISFNFITFVSNLAMPPTGYIDLFTMRGPLWSSSSVRFKLDMLDSRAPAGIFKATKDFFHLRQTALNQAIISLKKSIEGPQEIDLQLSMELYHGGVFGGSAVAKLSIFVSEYEF
ncbi:fibulin-1 isoform X7 [Zootermopsis nevadensis]|uniref:fibulin-1 isoform X7 n=1 Tax=Zootermopsis nevadensis TaxID=136037 RepID=UPI000B8E586F|nr:fibulin-1 isoform X7 [Zootermopsis nevadensis]